MSIFVRVQYVVYCFLLGVAYVLALIELFK
jgi:hypothetical protein